MADAYRAVTGADIALVIITLKDLGFAVPTIIASVALFIAGSAALYMAAAIQINAAFEKTVLPIPGSCICPIFRFGSFGFPLLFVDCY